MWAKNINAQPVVSIDTLIRVQTVHVSRLHIAFIVSACTTETGTTRERKVTKGSLDRQKLIANLAGRNGAECQARPVGYICLPPGFLMKTNDMETSGLLCLKIGGTTRLPRVFPTQTEWGSNARLIRYAVLHLIPYQRSTRVLYSHIPSIDVNGNAFTKNTLLAS